MLSEAEMNGVALDSIIINQRAEIKRLHQQVAELSSAILDASSSGSQGLAVTLALSECRVANREQAKEIERLKDLVSQQGAFIAAEWKLKVKCTTDAAAAAAAAAVAASISRD